LRGMPGGVAGERADRLAPRHIGRHAVGREMTGKHRMMHGAQVAITTAAL